MLQLIVLIALCSEQEKAHSLSQKCMEFLISINLPYQEKHLYNM